MSGLYDVLPRTQLIDRFGSKLVLEEYGKSQMKVIAMKNPTILHGVAANVWNRIVSKHWHPVDPQQLSSYFQNTDAKLHAAIANLVGTEVIRDIYWVKGWRKKPKVKSNLVVEILVAWVYRNDLQLGDITFIDPDSPLAQSAKRFRFQTYRGLGLLPTFLTNLQSKAEELGCEQLTLTAAAADQVNLFTRHGFAVEDSEVGRLTMKAGYGGIPMERNV